MSTAPRTVISLDLARIGAERKDLKRQLDDLTERLREIDTVLRPALEAARPAGIPFDGESEWMVCNDTPASAHYPALGLVRELDARRIDPRATERVMVGLEVRPDNELLAVLALADPALARWLREHRALKGARAGAIRERGRKQA